jgi:thiol-disulfide isomerase/thioredoxin
MSGLLFLTHEDFSVQKTEKGNIMANSIPGFSLILFYSTYCEHCKELIPIFKKLPGTMGGCQFGMINVSSNRPCVDMSQNTIAPIKYVPYIILYFNGVPFMTYKGAYRDDEIRKFVIDVANNIQKKQQFSKATVTKENNEDANSIPAYCTGKPICGGKDQLVCYINFDGYEKLQKTTQNKIN